MKILPSLIRYHLSLGPATIAFVNSAAFAPTLTSRQPTPSPPLLYIPNSTTVTLCTLTFRTQINRLQHIQNSLVRTVANTPKYSHITPVLKSLHWLKIEQRIQYELISLIYKILATSQPTYLHNLISLQTDNNTRSSDVVTLAHPSPASSLKVTDRSFQYASPHLWNKLLFSLREPVSPLYAYLNPSFSSTLSPSITPSLFHSKLKTYLFGKSFPP